MAKNLTDPLEFMETPFRVEFSGNLLPVYLNIGSGYFTTNIDDATVAKETLEQLNTYCEGLEKRRAAKVAVPKAREVASLGHDNKGNLTLSHYTITGLSVDGSRVKSRGAKEPPSGYDRLYSPFDIAEQNKLRDLHADVVAAGKAYNEFRDSKFIGTAKDVAREVEAGK